MPLIRDHRVVYAGTDAGRRAGLETVLEGSALSLGGAIDDARDALVLTGTPPGVVVLDAGALDADTAMGRLAVLDAVWPDSAVVVVHDDTDPAVVRALLDAGATSIVPTTTGPGRLRATLEAAGEGHGLIDVDVVRPVIDLYANVLAESRRRNRAVIESLAAAVEAKDTVTSRHLRAVSRMATQLARQIAPELAASDDFLFGCLLHDVGKIGVPEQILSKPGALTPQEWQIMRRHPQTGATVVRPLGLSEIVLDVVLYHHERWDGLGYPEGRREHDIPLAARIFSVCDALEAMTADRPYRAALPVQVAFERVLVEAGTQFDPHVVAALERGIATGAVELDVDPDRGDGRLEHGRDGVRAGLAP